jgi:acyl carrier protein
MQTRDEILSRLRGFVDDNFLYMRPGFELRDDTSLLRQGILDSMGVMEMVEFISSEFGVTVADTDITEANIGTLGSIADYVLARRTDTDRQIA